MTKRIIIVILSVMLMLSSCSPNVADNKYTFYCFGSKPFYGLDKSNMMERIYSTTYDNYESQKILDINFEDTVYSCEYEETINYIFWDDNPVDLYNLTNVLAYVNPRTGELVSFCLTDWCSNEYLLKKQETNAEILNEESCFNIASEFLEQKVADFDEYDFYVGAENTSPQKCTSYTFRFVRFIDKMKTTDELRVEVTCYGDIVSFNIIPHRHMKDVQLPTEEDMRLIETELDIFIRSIFSEYVYDYEYEITDIEFTRYHGKYALIYYVDVKTQETKVDKMQSHGSHLSFIVYV